MKRGELTDRQRRAFELRQTGMKYREIGKAIGTTKEQARSLVARARWKLGLRPEIFEEGVQTSEKV